jgi:acetolactate synthase I/II/III large subunit
MTATGKETSAPPDAKASDLIAHILFEHDVRYVFEVIGGMTTHMIDSLHRFHKIRVVSVHHEQAAAFAADAFARMTGIPGVAMATSGPGATNLLTGIGSCYFDSVPGVFITGQVNRHEQRGERPIRQLGFQETDIVAMAAPITKAAWRVHTAEELPRLLDDAFRLACAGRPGPVLLDIPMDVQRAAVFSSAPQARARTQPLAIDEVAVREMWKALSRAERPLIIAGAGVRASGSIAVFRKFVAVSGVPVACSLLGVDVLPFDDCHRVGMLGSYGNRWTNLAVGRADFLLVLGSRLDIRQTGSDTKAFKGTRSIWHVDCEAGEINNRVDGCNTIVCDLREFLDSAVNLAPSQPDRQGWIQEIRSLRTQWPDDAEQRDVRGISPNRLMHQLSAASVKACAFIADVGQHQMWAAQSLDVNANQRFLTSGGMGAMGYGLPAAIGAAFAQPGFPVVLIAGDGGFQLNIQELQTVVHNHLPVKIIILNNQCQGMVRQFQQSYFEARYASTWWGYSAPDFAKVAQAYGVEATTIARPEDVPVGLQSLWQDSAEPYLLQVMIDPLTNAYPKIAFGRPMTEMEPLATPLEIEST